MSIEIYRALLSVYTQKSPWIRSKELCIHSKEPCLHSKEPIKHPKETSNVLRICGSEEAREFAHANALRCRHSYKSAPTVIKCSISDRDQMFRGFVAVRRRVSSRMRMRWNCRDSQTSALQSCNRKLMGLLPAPNSPNISSLFNILRIWCREETHEFALAMQKFSNISSADFV